MRIGEHQKYTVISLFAGCGGSSLGYKMAGFEELLAVEWDKNAAETFSMNFPGVPLFIGDIAKLTSQECLELAGISSGELSVLDGSPPCQGFSMIGKRKIDDPRNVLFEEFVRLLKALRPKVFVMENVTGLIQGHMKKYYLEIVETLRSCGYQVKGEILNAQYFNVPQKRRRVIIIGVRNDLGIIPSHPRPQTTPTGPKKEKECDARILTEKDNYKVRRHKAKNIIKKSAFGYHEITEREPVNTVIKTHILTNGFFWPEGNHLRMPSETELKRMGSFPDDFKFTNYKKAWERIGNSVPPMLMRAIAEHIKTEILDKVNA